MHQFLLDYRHLVISFAAQQLDRDLNPEDFSLHRIPYNSDFYAEGIEYYDNQDPPLRFRVYLRIENYEGIRDFRLYEEPNHQLTNVDEVYVAEGTGTYKLLMAFENYLSDDIESAADYNIILTDAHTPLITGKGEFIFWTKGAST